MLPRRPRPKSATPPSISVTTQRSLRRSSRALDQYGHTRWQQPAPRLRYPATSWAVLAFRRRPREKRNAVFEKLQGRGFAMHQGSLFLIAPVTAPCP